MQDTFARALVALGCTPHGVSQPRAWLFRIASNLLLAPQERAALVLKEAFDLSLEEIAAALSTSVGAVKAARHRGRDKVKAPEAPRERERATSIDGYRPGPAGAEACAHRGETIVPYWHAQEGGEVVRDISRVELDGDRVAHWRGYFFSPDVIAEICRELAVPFRTNGYTYWRKGS